MHVVGVNLDLSLFLQLITTAFVVVVALLYAVKKTASKYFEVDASFEGDQAVSCRSSMPGVLVDDSSCFVCGDPGSKKCSRCKRVRYCSPKCQEKHWNSGHKTDCKVFQPSQSLSSAQNGLNGSHYQNLNGGSKSCNGIALVPSRGFSKPVNIKQLKEVLFPYNEFVKLFNWDKPGYLPCGLLNCGNSCFVNVVLQCLASTRPLVAYLLEKGHRSECIRSDWCFLCELQTHIERASHSPQAFSPTNIISRLPNIGGNLGYGRQEDAHEFMRFAIDTMQSVCLDEFGGEKAVPPTLQETTVIQHIFGGHLQSQVICTNCNNISNQYENMMDLTVEIHGEATSLEECLDQFTAEECLQGDNMYKCDGCNDYVKAWKRLTIKEPPNILTIALKRFQSGRFGKLNKRVTFPESLNLSVYTNEAGESGDGEDEDLYNLYAVLVHVDMLNASFFGHYICYVKDFSGNWYRLDDCKVARVDLEEVLSQGAYMLFYSRVKARPSCLRARKEVQSIVANGEAVDLSPEDEDCPLTNGSSPVGVVISPSNTSFLTSKSETPVEANSDSITEHLNNPPPILGLSTPSGEEEEDTSNSSVSSSSSSSSESSSSSSSNGFDRVSVDVSSDRECMEVTRFGSAFEEKPYPENGFSGLDRERRNGTHLVESKGMEICSDDQIESTMQVEENVQKGIGLCSSMLRADIGSSQMWVDLQIENGNRSDSVDVTE